MTELALGTVQFGLGYGIGGRDRPVEEAEARRILACAHDHGVRRLDTAPAYGDIEQRLRRLCGGRSFEIVSKVPSVPRGLSDAETVPFVIKSIETSRAALGDLLHGLIFHDIADLDGERGAAIWQAAASIAAQSGLKIGVSSYASARPSFELGEYPVEMVQLPGSALDQRVASWPAVERDYEISLRSIFLQGLLLMTSAQAKQRLPRAAPFVLRWLDWCQERRLTPVDGALSVAKGFAGVSYCLVGVDDIAQLREILAHWESATPIMAPELACADLSVIDPRQW